MFAYVTSYNHPEPARAVVERRFQVTLKERQPLNPDSISSGSPPWIGRRFSKLRFQLYETRLPSKLFGCPRERRLPANAADLALRPLLSSPTPCGRCRPESGGGRSVASLDSREVS